MACQEGKTANPITNRKDLKLVDKRVMCCVEDTGNTDELTTKRRKYIVPTLQNSVHRLASTLGRTALPSIYRITLTQRLNQSWLHNRSIYYIMQ